MPLGSGFLSRSCTGRGLSARGGGVGGSENVRRRSVDSGMGGSGFFGSPRGGGTGLDDVAAGIATAAAAAAAYVGFWAGRGAGRCTNVGDGDLLCQCVGDGDLLGERGGSSGGFLPTFSWGAANDDDACDGSICGRTGRSDGAVAKPAEGGEGDGEGPGGSCGLSARSGIGGAAARGASAAGREAAAGESGPTYIVARGWYRFLVSTASMSTPRFTWIEGGGSSPFTRYSKSNTTSPAWSYRQKRKSRIGCSTGTYHEEKVIVVNEGFQQAGGLRRLF